MKNKPVFVFDTNSLISALLSPQSTVAKALKQAEKTGVVVYSSETFNEFCTVLMRIKFDKYFSQEERIEIINRVSVRYKLIKPKITINECRDPKDNMFLELALSANAKCIITGDEDLLIMNPFRNIPILKTGEFLVEFGTN